LTMNPSRPPWDRERGKEKIESQSIVLKLKTQLKELIALPLRGRNLDGKGEWGVER